jgi:hypothetical protein
MNSRPGVTATTDMAVLPGVLGLPGGTPIFFALAALRSVPHRKRHLRQAGSQFRGLATAMHEISGLERTEAEIDTMWRSIEDFTLSVESLPLPWRSTGIDLAFYY